MATQTSDVSSSFQSIISKSDLTRSGSPALYQLRPNKEKLGNLTKMSFGVKNPNKRNKTILLVGETGTGKTTLINTLFNYAMGVKFDHDIWFEIVKDEATCQCESQTSDVMVYEICEFEVNAPLYTLTIIDTPGYGSTRGLEEDIMVGERLFDLFSLEGGVNEIDAVGLVMKASDNRLSDRLTYIFNSVVSLFGKDLEKNIIVLITHSNGLTPTNVLTALEAANIRCARDEENQPVHFLFDNCQSQQRTRKKERALKFAWESTDEAMDEFTLFLERCAPQKMVTTVEVLHNRMRLAACIHNLQDRIWLTELKQTEIKQTQDALKKNEREMKQNEDFTVEVDEACKVKQSIDGGRWWLFFSSGATCCTVCEEVCHYPCTVAPHPEKCKIMEKSGCLVCTKKCPASAHVKDTWIYVNETRKVKKTIKQMKMKYDQNKTESEKKLSLLEDLEKEMKDLTANKDQLLEEAYQHVIRLEQIALCATSLSTYVHLDFLIERMKEKGDKEKIQKLVEMKNQGDKGMFEVLRYTYTKLRSVGSRVKRAYHAWSKPDDDKMMTLTF